MNSSNHQVSLPIGLVCHFNLLTFYVFVWDWYFNVIFMEFLWPLIIKVIFGLFPVR